MATNPRMEMPKQSMKGIDDDSAKLLRARIREQRLIEQRRKEMEKKKSD